MFTSKVTNNDKGLMNCTGNMEDYSASHFYTYIKKKLKPRRYLSIHFCYKDSASESAVPALPEVVALSFPGQCEVEEISEWVAAAAGLRGGSAGGPGPPPGRENAGAEKGPGPGREIGEGAAHDPRTEDAPDKSPRRHRSTSPSPSRLKERRDEEKKEAKETKSKERQITEEDLEGKTEEEIEMMKLMGFASFDSTKGKKVDGSVNAYAINVSQKRKYRQYMNRKGGFNRPLDFIA
ncbi:small nuclear ribonucleoprotein U4/U6.U5 subunit 27 [Phyllostomus discolor]|uniref:U4/U6.U5 small nuclear ribonucleoprotein 27 kDa protein n=1 Tax=Phyllostomus discolor TaxID=89673 RepID=A0A834E7C5_9CHIR|nr:small nuclear ribonucleoprotein U4/U6.U5 subunit 27 [Phyllostomus discolor]